INLYFFVFSIIAQSVDNLYKQSYPQVMVIFLNKSENFRDLDRTNKIDSDQQSWHPRQIY
ncbi:hypothetical protein CGH46_17870, partial [Vibrio parahaemolyticus]